MTGMRRFVLTAAAVLAATLAGVGGASALTGGHDHGPGEHEPGPRVDPREGSVRVHAASEDPSGGPRWAVRAYESVEGQSCVEAGRVTPAGRYGRLDPGGAVAELPTGPHGTCGDFSVDPVILVVDTRPARGDVAARTVLFGRAGPAVQSVSAGAPGSSMAPLPLSAQRTFLIVAEGIHPPSSFPVDVRMDDGSVRTIRW